MFAFLRRRPAPEGPVEFNLAVEVDKPTADVYPLIDWADPRNAKRELGHKVEALTDGRFRLVLTEMPEHRFDIDVLDVVSGEKYGFVTEIVPRVGRLECSEEHYSVEPNGDGRCTLRLTVVATFRRGLSMKQFEEELRIMSIACHRAVAKLKVHAEGGVEAVKALELAF